MTRRPRIKVLFPYSDGETIGGSHRSSLMLIAKLDRDLFDPVVLLHGVPGAVGRHIESLGLQTLRLRTPPVMAGRLKRGADDASFGRYLLQSVPALVRLLRREQIDIVHTNDGGMHVSWALPTKLAGARLVWHHRQSPDAKGVNLVAPILADRILSVSEFSRPARPILPVARRFEVIRSPFELSPDLPDRAAARAALLTEIGARPEAILIGYFGALTRRKRPEHFVRVIQALRHAMPERDFHGLIFGSEPIKGLGIQAECKALAEELGIARRVHLMGHRSSVEVLMAAVDVVSITALEEPFGRTLIEAMHVGTPVVATRHGGNPEAITDEDTGFLVDHEAPEAFVPAIRRLLDDPQLRHEITGRAATFARGLTVDAHVAKVSAVYRDLVSKGRDPLDAVSGANEGAS